jgi:putative membrane protein
MLDKKKDLRFTNILSGVILLVVALMMGLRTKIELGSWTASLPKLNAIINSITTLLLLMGLWFIKKKDINNHKRTMTTAFCFGGLFLVFYVLYHISNQSTKFGGEGPVRFFYYFNLVTHILGSLLVLPFVLRAIYFGWNRMDEEHRKVTKIAFPIWLYVSVTGVIAYLLIEPYYTF